MVVISCKLYYFLWYVQRNRREALRRTTKAINCKCNDIINTSPNTVDVPSNFHCSFVFVVFVSAFQGALFGLAGMFPSRYIQAVMAGQVSCYWVMCAFISYYVPR